MDATDEVLMRKTSEWGRSGFLDKVIMVEKPKNSQRSTEHIVRPALLLSCLASAK